MQKLLLGQCCDFSATHQSLLYNVSLARTTLLSGPGWSEVIKGWLTVSTWNYPHWIMTNPMECIIHLLHNQATCIAEGLFKTSYVFTIIHNMQFVVNVKHRKRRTTITLLFFLYLFREHCWSEFFLLLVSIHEFQVPGFGLQFLDSRFWISDSML